eukprot:25388_1
MVCFDIVSIYLLLSLWWGLHLLFFIQIFDDVAWIDSWSLVHDVYSLNYVTISIFINYLWSFIITETYMDIDTDANNAVTNDDDVEKKNDENAENKNDENAQNKNDDDSDLDVIVKCAGCIAEHPANVEDIVWISADEFHLQKYKIWMKFGSKGPKEKKFKEYCRKVFIKTGHDIKCKWESEKRSLKRHCEPVGYLQDNVKPRKNLRDINIKYDLVDYKRMFYIHKLGGTWNPLDNIRKKFPGGIESTKKSKSKSKKNGINVDDEINEIDLRNPFNLNVPGSEAISLPPPVPIPTRSINEQINIDQNGNISIPTNFPKMQHIMYKVFDGLKQDDKHALALALIQEEQICGRRIYGCAKVVRHLFVDNGAYVGSIPEMGPLEDQLNTNLWSFIEANKQAINKQVQDMKVLGVNGWTTDDLSDKICNVIINNPDQLKAFNLSFNWKRVLTSRLQNGKENIFDIWTWICNTIHKMESNL